LRRAGLACGANCRMPVPRPPVSQPERLGGIH
jgi:hypothetical protein